MRRSGFSHAKVRDYERPAKIGRILFMPGPFGILGAVKWAIFRLVTLWKTIGMPPVLSDDDRRHGMGIVVEYAGHKGKPQWTAPPPSHWNYVRFTKPGVVAPTPDETFEMVFAKDNAAEEALIARRSME